MVLMLLGPLCGWWGAPPPVGAQTLDADVQALLAFKAGGDADGDLSSWDPAAGSPCGVGWNSDSSGWEGVRCDAEGGRVTRVSLPNKGGVSGTLESLAAITGLTYINLMSTAVTGSVESLAACTGLNILFLTNTFVSGDAAILRSSVTGLSDWTDFTACSSWTCAAGSLVERPSEHAGRTGSACCDAFCAGNAVGPDFSCSEPAHLTPDASQIEGYSEDECCDPDLCNGNVDEVDDHQCSSGSLISGALAVTGGVDWVRCAISARARCFCLAPHLLHVVLLLPLSDSFLLVYHSSPRFIRRLHII